MGMLDRRVAFVTGAARGLGRSHAVHLAAEGADIIVVDIGDPSTGADGSTPAALADTARQVEATGRRVVARIADVRDQDALDAAVADGIAELGRLDVVVANAGISSWGRFWELSEEQWLDMIDINLSGVWRTLRAAVPALIDQGHGGSIITISSVAGLKALPAQAHYTAAKHGVVGLTKAAAIELGPYGIRVNSVHPWGVATEMATGTHHETIIGANPTYAQSFGSILPEPRLAEPADISAAVVWLASDASRCVTGIQLPVDMGATTV